MNHCPDCGAASPSDIHTCSPQAEQPAQHSRDAVTWTPETGYVFKDQPAQKEPIGWLYPEGLAALKAGMCWTAYGTKQDARCSIPIYDAVAPRVEPPAMESGGGFESRPASPTAQDDPCPGCRKGGVCRTPKCGRLRLPLDHPFRSQQPAQQELVGEIGKVVMFGGDLKEVSWKNGKMPPVGSILYTRPKAREPMHFSEETAAFKTWFDAWYVCDGEQGETIPTQSDPHYPTYLYQYTLCFGVWMAAKHAAHGIKGEA